MSRPAKVEVLESHSGADTMPGWLLGDPCGGTGGEVHTALDEDVQTLLNEQSGVQDYESVAERQHIVRGADFEKRSYRSLVVVYTWSAAGSSHLPEANMVYPAWE